MKELDTIPDPLRELVATLNAEQCSCVIRNGTQIRIFRERGVKDLYRLLRDEPELLRGASLADKVVGKAAAALMILGDIRELYTHVVSQPALDLFSAASHAISYGELTPHIINRAGTGWCPLETRCDSLQTPEECLAQIEAFIQEMTKD